MVKDQGGHPLQEAADRVSHAAQTAYEQVSGVAQDAYQQGSRVVREQREKYPKAERYLREGTETVREPIRDSPVLAILLAGALGYGLAYLFHARETEQRRSDVPDYARSRTRYRYDRD
jgi:hypothetical protein